MPPSTTARLGMYVRRFRFWLLGFRLWPMATLLLLTLAFLAAGNGRPLGHVLALSAGAIALAILSLKER